MTTRKVCGSIALAMERLGPELTTTTELKIARILHKEGWLKKLDLDKMPHKGKENAILDA